MKKIYLSISAVVLAISSIAQQNLHNPFGTNDVKQKAVLSQGSRSIVSSTKNSIGSLNAKTASSSFTLYVEPVGDVMTNKGLLLDGSASANQDVFLDPIFMDSSVVYSTSSGNRRNSNILSGSILDPKSILLQSTFISIVNATEAYTLDSVFILGSYVQKNPAVVDTLYTWVVWGDTANTAVYSKKLDNAWWNAPIGDWRTNLLCPNVNRTAKTYGNKVYASAPSTNMVQIKYVLKPTDVATGAGFTNYVAIAMPTPILIPADNVVSCFYTFVPGTPYAVNDVIYEFSGATTPQNKNGFAAAVWGQVTPAVTALADYVDHQVDPNGYNGGVGYDKYQRHQYNTATNWNCAPMDLVSAPVIVYRITGPALPTGVTELEKTGIALSQNIPNPFTSGSIIRYNLAKDASSAVFTVTDVMGRIISSEKVNAATGVHSIKLGAYAAGLYYYSLNVDGNVATKKMIVE